MTNKQTETLRAAAKAVIDRWETPKWKDAPATAAVAEEAIEGCRA